MECPGFNELREEMWSGKRETDLTKLLDTPALAAKASKFLLATGELLQFRHLNEARDSRGDSDAETEDGTLMGNGW